ncbi:MAG: hypothetical protein KAH77_10380 [Thiomargarita sp.]|nr:hypothetical protein [Thiomargarita sp.]
MSDNDIVVSIPSTILNQTGGYLVLNPGDVPFYSGNLQAEEREVSKIPTMVYILADAKEKTRFSFAILGMKLSWKTKIGDEWAVDSVAVNMQPIFKSIERKEGKKKSTLSLYGIGWLGNVAKPMILHVSGLATKSIENALHALKLESIANPEISMDTLVFEFGFGSVKIIVRSADKSEEASVYPFSIVGFHKRSDVEKDTIALYEQYAINALKNDGKVYERLANTEKARLEHVVN